MKMNLCLVSKDKYEHYIFNNKSYLHHRYFPKYRHNRLSLENLMLNHIVHLLTKQLKFPKNKNIMNLIKILKIKQNLLFLIIRM